MRKSSTCSRRPPSSRRASTRFPASATGGNPAPPAPSILNASPEAAAGGGLALIKTGDRVRIDLKKRTANILISDTELNERRASLALHGGYDYPKSQTPWQQIQREMVAQFDEGMVLKPAVAYQRLAQIMGAPRDNH